MSAKRYCDSCGDPLGSTRGKCHQCGGESIRADNAGTFESNDLFDLLGGML
jgi:hypothetical protein